MRKPKVKAKVKKAHRIKFAIQAAEQASDSKDFQRIMRPMMHRFESVV